MTVVTDQLTVADNRIKHQESHIQTLLKKNQIMEEEKKRQNIIIIMEGIKEDTNQHPKQQILDMLNVIGGNKPRPILVKFTNVNSKYEVYRNVKNLSNSDKWKYIRIHRMICPRKCNNKEKK